MYIIQITLPGALDYDLLKTRLARLEGWQLKKTPGDDDKKKEKMEREGFKLALIKKVKALLEVAQAQKYSPDEVQVRKVAEIAIDFELLHAGYFRKKQNKENKERKRAGFTKPILHVGIYTEEEVLSIYTDKDSYRVAKAWKGGAPGNVMMLPNVFVKTCIVQGLKY